MAVKIRLTRTGSRNAASFRVVAADSRFPRDGRYLENLGWYDPKLAGAKFELKTDRIAFWRSQGAEISDTVASLLKQDRNAPADAGKVAEARPPAAVEPVAAAEPVVSAPEPAPEPAAEAAPVAEAESVSEPGSDVVAATGESAEEKAAL